MVDDDGASESRGFFCGTVKMTPVCVSSVRGVRLKMLLFSGLLVWIWHGCVLILSYGLQYVRVAPFNLFNEDAQDLDFCRRWHRYVCVESEQWSGSQDTCALKALLSE